MGVAINRMQLFSGDLDGRNAPIRPPWSLPEAEFIEICSGCGDCLPACEEGLIKEGRGRLPLIDFTAGGCDFCRQCVDACKTGALRDEPAGAAPPWRLKAQLLDHCLSLNATVCRACGEACDPRAITFKLRVGGIADPIIDSDQCTGCGACLAVCPVASIRMQVPDPVVEKDIRIA